MSERDEPRRLPDRLRPWAAAEREEEDAATATEADAPKVIIPPRQASPGMAFAAIAAIFVIGLVVGFVLAKTF